MSKLFWIIIPAIIACICVCSIFPLILKVAKVKNIVDNPDARKLQRVPVPVLGGLAVAFGTISGVMGLSLFENTQDFFPIFSAFIIILLLGLIDDMISLSPRFRFVAEIILVLYLIYTTGCQLNNFHGLWGLDIIPDYISIPLTIFACVGIINAINLIDGVDGYSSGYSMVSCIEFGVMFYALGNIHMVAISAIVAASLLPFFLHNVFGKKSKMFIGDAGTLSIGIIYSIFVITLLSAEQGVSEIPANLGLIPFMLAVLCIPVFDTVRVMISRVKNGKSPFNPDKTHLHHLFLEFGFSHVGISVSIICINLMIVLCWYLAYRCGLSIDAQLYIVLTLGAFVTFVFYPFAKAQMRKQTKFYGFMRKLAEMSHIERTGFWLFAQNWLDKSVEEDIKNN